MKTVGWVVGVVALGFCASTSAQTPKQTETQQNEQGPSQPTAPHGGTAARCADPCAACMARINGTGSSAEAASCPNACSLCDRMHATSGGQGQAKTASQAGQSTAQPEQGPDVTASLDSLGRSVSSSVNSAASEVKQNFGEVSDRGIQGVGLRRNTLVTDAVGTFTGIGLNAEYQRPLAEKISGVAGAHYSRTNTVGGSATTFGGTLGADYFLVGGYNQGLRLGPRVGVDVGGVSANSGDTNIDARVGLAGELGYNWMGRSGVSMQLALGAGGRVGGSVGGLNDQFGGDFGPYVRANVGWSW